MEKVETQLALVSKEFPVFNLMQLKTGWTLVHEDPISGLFVRERSPWRRKYGSPRKRTYRMRVRVYATHYSQMPPAAVLSSLADFAYNLLERGDRYG